MYSVSRETIKFKAKEDSKLQWQKDKEALA